MRSFQLKPLLLCLVPVFILYSNLVHSNDEDLDTPFYEDDVFAVYPSKSYWCEEDSKYSDNVELDVVYNVNHAQRDKKLFYGHSNSHYSRFFNRIISPIIAKHCPSYRGWKATAKLHFNTREDWLSHNRRDWDRLRFEYIKSRGAKLGFQGMFVGHYLSDYAVATMSKKAAERREYAKHQGRPFRGLAGGAYHDTIYTGSFAAQNKVAWYYLSQIKINNEKDVAMGVVLSMFGSAFSTTKKDMTLLEEVSMYYLKRSTERPDDCFDYSAEERTFTYSYPELVYGDGYRIPASKINSKYRINAKFSQLCDRLCEKQGVLYMVANGMNEKMEKLEIADLFRGVDEMLKYYSCRSPEIKKFESNLLEFNRKEFSQPSSVRRNTFQNMLDGPLTKYLPVPLQPHSIIADQFMTDNYKKPGVVTTTSGLQYILITPGRGQHPESGDVVSIFYKESLENGRVLDKRYVSGTPRTSSIDDFLTGMTEGIRLLKPGGRIKIFVPPELGYGAEADGVVNKDSVLLYEIELVKSTNSPSHIGEPYTLDPGESTRTVKKDITKDKKAVLPPKSISAEPPQEKTITTKVPVVEPVIIPKLLASEDRSLTNEYQFQKEITLDNTLLDFLVVKLIPKQIDKNTWTAMLASRWNYERSENNPVGGRFFHPNATHFSTKEIDTTMGEFQQWMKLQSSKLTTERTIPASVVVAKIGGTIQAIPADGCAILDEKTRLIHHQSKLINAISLSAGSGMQICQQKVKSNVDDIMSCIQSNPNDPSYCRQQIQSKLEQCLEDNSKNAEDTWDKVSVKWVDSKFDTNSCGGHIAYDRSRSNKQIQLGVGAVQLSPSRISIRFIFDKELELPQVTEGIFALQKNFEEGLIKLKLKPNSENIKLTPTDQGLNLEVHAAIVDVEYVKK